MLIGFCKLFRSLRVFRRHVEDSEGKESPLFTKIAYFTSAAAIAQKIAKKGKKEIFRTIEKVEKEGKFEFSQNL